MLQYYEQTAAPFLQKESKVDESNMKKLMESLIWASIRNVGTQQDGYTADATGEENLFGPLRILF